MNNTVIQSHISEPSESVWQPFVSLVFDEIQSGRGRGTEKALIVCAYVAWHSTLYTPANVTGNIWRHHTLGAGEWWQWQC